MSSATKRLIKELGQIHRDGSLDPLVTLSPVSDEDLFTWKAMLNGPPDTPYEGIVAALSTVACSYACHSPGCMYLTLLSSPQILARIGGVFELLISIPDSYPIQPPSLKFLTTVCHPNVKFDSGEICLDILKDQWSPAWTIKSTCLAISLLLSNPEPSSPLNCDVANLLRCGDRIGYDSLVRYYTQKYATPHPSFTC